MAHILVNIQGSSPGGEVWSCGLRYAQIAVNSTTPDTGDTNLTTPEQLQNVANRLVALPANQFPGEVLLARLSTSLRIMGVKVSRVSDEGVTLGAADATFNAGGRVGTSVALCPPQVSVCISLNKGSFYGRTGRGRVFWPAVGGQTNLGADLRLPTAQVQAIAAGFNTMQQAIGAAINDEADDIPAHQLVVYSPKTDTVLRVAVLGVGDVLDTQRRRRDRLDEAYTVISRS